MDKKLAIALLQNAYPNLKVDKIIDDGDKFIAQMNKKDGQIVLGGIKAIYKKTKRVVEVNPLRIKGLVQRLQEADYA